MWAKGFFSLFAFSHANSHSSLPFSKELFQFIPLCRPVAMSYKCPSPAVDQEKSNDRATPKRRGEESQPQVPLRVLQTLCSAASRSPAEGLVCSV